ncbi:N-6 DNA methylase [Fibrobacterota bacterium]
MISGTLKSRVDRLWLEFYSGGITNPLTVIEQLSYLIFARMLDITESRNEKKASRLKQLSTTPIFPKNKQHLRWIHLQNLGADEQLKIVRDDLFDFFRNGFVKNTTLGPFLKDAQCMVVKASVIKTAINVISEFPLAQGDTKGDLYEYLLSKLSSAGVAGQFRTPRHIIKAMVEILDVKPTDKVCDPACGTGGFLVSAMEYIRRTHTSPDMVQEEINGDGKPVLDDHGNPVKHYPGDQLSAAEWNAVQKMFHGFDFDSTMLRIAAMNMLLHNLENPCIEYHDSLSERFADEAPQYHQNAFDVILANPPFKGNIDEDTVHSSLTAVTKTKKTELLFIALMHRMLKTGGRCAVIVPDGVLFGSSKAHLAIREMLVEKNQLEAVISLPSGVFRPYAGVNTAIIVFYKGGKTDNVWFYKVENDGYSLDDKRTPIKESDLDDLVLQWKKKDGKKKTKRTDKGFFVPKSEITDNKYDLSINRYKEEKYEEVEYEPPKVILKKMKVLENEIKQGIIELEEMLRC